MIPHDPGRAALARRYAACVRARVAAQRDEAEALAQLRRYETDAAEDARLEVIERADEILAARERRSAELRARVEAALARKVAA